MYSFESESDRVSLEGIVFQSGERENIIVEFIFYLSDLASTLLLPV